MSDRTTTGRTIAAIGGILLIVSLFLTWAGASAPSGQFAPNIEADTSFNAFDLFGFMPFVFLLIGILALLPAALDVLNLDVELPFENSLVAVIGGVLAVGSLLLVIDGGGSKSGAYLAFLAAITIAVGGFMQMGEDDTSLNQYAVAPAATSTSAAPPTAAPPASPPPTVAPSAAPPAEQPPAEQPPAEQPPAEQPPAPQPPQPPAV